MLERVVSLMGYSSLCFRTDKKETQGGGVWSGCVVDDRYNNERKRERDTEREYTTRVALIFFLLIVY